MKFIDNFDDHDWARLEEQRRTFILYIKGEVKNFRDIILKV